MSLLKLDDLYQAQEKRTRSNRKVYEEILKQCHRRIVTINQRIQLTQCYFSIPPYIFGYPAYDLEDVNEWLCKQLTRNGFLVYPIDIQTIYVCWDPSLIDYDRYMKNLQKESRLTITTEAELLGLNESDSPNNPPSNKPPVETPRAGTRTRGPRGASKTGRARANKITMAQDQPLAVIKFDSDFEDLIPVNTKKIKGRKSQKKNDYAWF